MRSFILFILCFSSITGSAQKKPGKEFFLVYDRNWQPCKIDSAHYLAYVQNINDTTWQWSYYNYAGPLVNIETYKDEKATIPHGYFAYFNEQGKIDSGGNTLKGLKNGTWYYYEDSTSPQLTREYEMGRLLNEKRTEKTDAFEMISIEPGEKEAEFRGGTKNWIKYLEKNLKTPERAMNLHIRGTVMISFTVNVPGQIEDPHIVRSVEQSVDQEAMRIIINSPPWTPAEQDGRKVKAYRIQPVTFYVE